MDYSCCKGQKLIFRLGIDAGFFSEYNNMLLAMAWCLSNDVQFQLYSRNAWFGSKGWTEFFKSFSKEISWTIHDKINNRLGAPENKYHRYLTTKIYQIINPKHVLTYQVWNSFRNRQLEKEYFSIPEQNMEGNLQGICRAINEQIWQYNEKAGTEVEDVKKRVCLPDQYLGFHIRGGDKFKEDQVYPFGKYLEEMAKFSETRTAFILTDDFQAFEKAKKNFPEWEMYSLCEEDEKGYYHQEFMKRSQEYIRRKTIRLFASMDILKKSEKFMGTFSSNPGMFLGMVMEESRCLSVDGSSWRIW